MQYGGRSEVDIGGVPKIADDWSKYPFVVELYAEVEWHHDHGDEDVGEREGHNEVVGDHAEFPANYQQFNCDSSRMIRCNCM